MLKKISMEIREKNRFKKSQMLLRSKKLKLT